MTAETWSDFTAAETPMKRLGRPRRRDLTPHDLACVAAGAAAGETEAAVACQLGYSPRHFRRMKESDDRIADAWEVGRSKLHSRLVSKLIERALEGKTPELLFSLKTIFHYREQGEAPAPDDQTRLRIDLTLPKALPLERYSELVRAAQARAVAALPAAEVVP